MKTLKNQEQEKVWDKISKKWNLYRQTPSPSVEDFLKNKKGKILDLGSGSGRNFKVFHKSSQIYALDFSQKMLKYAKENAEKLNLKIETLKSESSKIPIENNFFDSAICIALLHCIPEKQKRQDTLKELFRVLKPKAQALISVWGRSSPRLRDKPKECFIEWSSGLEKAEKRYTYVYDKEELENELKSAGFKILQSWEEKNVNVIVEKF